MHVGHHRIVLFVGGTSVNLSSRFSLRTVSWYRRHPGIQQPSLWGYNCWRALLLDRIATPSGIQAASGKYPGFQVLFIDRNNAHLLPENRLFPVAPSADCRHLVRHTPGVVPQSH